jgi:hypothetical protein
MGALLVVPFVGIFYAWREWQRTIREVRLPIWRQVIVVVGPFSVTLQAIAFFALWTPFSQHGAFLRWALPIELFLVAPTVLSVFIWKYKARWWLLALSIFLCVDSFLVVVAASAY